MELITMHGHCLNAHAVLPFNVVPFGETNASGSSSIVRTEEECSRAPYTASWHYKPSHTINQDRDSLSYKKMYFFSRRDLTEKSYLPSYRDVKKVFFCYQTKLANHTRAFQIAVLIFLFSVALVHLIRTLCWWCQISWSLIARGNYV
jgi:hypothetical protein